MSEDDWVQAMIAAESSNCQSSPPTRDTWTEEPVIDLEWDTVSRDQEVSTKPPTISILPVSLASTPSKTPSGKNNILVAELKELTVEERKDYHDSREGSICGFCKKKKWNAPGNCQNKDHDVHYQAAVEVVAKWLEDEQGWKIIPRRLSTYHIWHWFHNLPCEPSKHEAHQAAHSKRAAEIRRQENQNSVRKPRLIMPKRNPNT
jgi:hypothetical protein